jgi:8-amino-7-oxononanoate synthase
VHLSGATLARYHHLDAAHADAQLHKHPAGAAMLVTDSVFSMDGVMAPLTDLAIKARDHGALMMVDEAHAIGVFGPAGAGLCAAQKLDERLAPIIMGTLGKAAGTFGAFIAAPAAVIEHLIQFARPFVFSTAMPPALAAATLTSVRLIRKEEWRRERLRQLVDRFRNKLASVAGHLRCVAHPHSPIQPLMVDGSVASAMKLAAFLRENNIYAPAIRPPTVAVGTARVRLSFSADHSERDVDALLAVLARFPVAQKK